MAGLRTNISFGEGNWGLQVAQNLGSIHAEIHVPPEQRDPPPLPSSNIPFRQDPDFVGRGPLLDQLRRSLSQPGARVALTGLGGVGKTQLAIEYTHRFRRDAPDTWVLWIHASNAARYETSIRDVADRLVIPGRSNPQANIFKLVYDRLCDANKGKWLLILDNADEVDFLFEPPSKSMSGSNGVDRPLIDYLPVDDHGSVLATTRRKQWAERLADSDDIIDVLPMDGDESLALLCKKMGTHDDTEVARQLVAELEYIPLAISQAGAYIKKRRPICSVQDYLHKLSQSGQSQSSLLDFDCGTLRRDRDAKNSVLLTWEISFDHIFESQRTAADLLSLMSFFDRQGIPNGLLQLHGRVGPIHGHTPWWMQDAATPSGDDVADAADEECLDNAVLILRDYSFIEYDDTMKAFTMHRLVQLATQKWLESHGQYQMWEEESLSRLNLAFPDGEYESWALCRLLYPHVQRAFKLETNAREATLFRASVLYRAAGYAFTNGNALDAETLANSAVVSQEATLGADNSETINSKIILSFAYVGQARWEEARKLGEEVLDAGQRVLGEDHPITLGAMGNLALFYDRLGDHEKAAELQERGWEASKANLGEDHQDTLTSMSNLAGYYDTLGDTKKALDMEERCWEARKANLGEAHPLALQSMSKLALYYSKLGDLEKAAEFGEICWQAEKEMYGEDHPETLQSLEWHIYFTRLEDPGASIVRFLKELAKHSITRLGTTHPDSQRRISALNNGDFEWVPKTASA